MKTSVMLVTAFLLAGAVSEVAAQRNGGRAIDREFIDMMIDHHRDGIEMARLAESKGRLDELQSFASRTISNQEKDLSELQAMRDEMFPRAAMSSGMTVNGRRMTMAEMKRMAQRDMRQLDKAREGRTFDRMFLDKFTMHHQMAINMSQQQIRQGSNPRLKAFSRKTINMQRSDIREMARMKSRVR